MTTKTARATCVIPGGIKTSIARTAQAAPGVDTSANADAFDRHIARTSANAAALKIIAASEKGKARVLIGPDARFVDYATRALGANYQWILPAMQSLRRHH
jgi:quinolinate synthase